MWQAQFVAEDGMVTELGTHAPPECASIGQREWYAMVAVVKHANKHDILLPRVYNMQDRRTTINVTGGRYSVYEIPSPDV